MIQSPAGIEVSAKATPSASRSPPVAQQRDVQDDEVPASADGPVNRLASGLQRRGVQCEYGLDDVLRRTQLLLRQPPFGKDQVTCEHRVHDKAGGQFADG